MIDVDIFSKEKYNYKQKEAKNVQNGYKTKRHGIDGKKTWRAAKKEKKKYAQQYQGRFKWPAVIYCMVFFFLLVLSRMRVYI